jgi:predicted nucleic acid-binding Zn ribbon protein
MTDEPLTICPECGAHIRRVLYPTGVIFKGSGFYKTDYNKNGALPPVNGDPGKTESAKSDTKTSESTSSDQGTSETKTTTSSENKTTRAAAS